MSSPCVNPAPSYCFYPTFVLISPGWASLLAAAGLSYHFAKKEIEARRKLQRESGTRPTAKKEWYERLGDPGANPSVVKSTTTLVSEASSSEKPPDETS
ncbi:hypothetical protein FRB94_001818 [Tulasnella sp. JGI-2019a]|nr:hypothetical protein FRB93_004297 [Tulasnella sp. JGI-2019a]KAG9005126.1 hypothetical protein FRB94_001818 [Tulasnella sp. JGI-2019a]KAG9028098.1 hypothetical protein FRB95_006862 [Tulasnella sp. JGI-2019a]